MSRKGALDQIRGEAWLFLGQQWCWGTLRARGARLSGLNLCVALSPVIERLCLCALGSACSHALRVSQADNGTKQGVPMATPHQILRPSPYQRPNFSLLLTLTHFPFCTWRYRPIRRLSWSSRKCFNIHRSELNSLWFPLENCIHAWCCFSSWPQRLPLPLILTRECTLAHNRMFLCLSLVCFMKQSLPSCLIWLSAFRLRQFVI